jgi:hypothetical protein
MPLSDWRDGYEHLDAQDWPAIYDRGYLQANIAGGEGFDWFYASPEDRAAQVRTPITDGAAGKPWVFRYKDLRAWWENQHFDRPGGVESATPTAWVPQSKPIWFTELGCPAVDRGTNQPNVFFDPKSSESFLPYFSRGWRDDAIQRAYLEATYLWWGEPANNPVSSSTAAHGARAGMRRLDLGRAAVPVLPRARRRLDRRPELAARALADRAARRGLARGARAPPLPAGGAARGAHRRLRPLGRRRGLHHHRAREPARLDHHARPALRLRRRRERRAHPLRHARARAGGTVTLDDLVAPAAAQGDVIELTRAQETELPQALKWQIARADEEYDTTVVEARRITVEAARVAAETFPMAVPPEEAAGAAGAR